MTTRCERFVRLVFVGMLAASCAMGCKPRVRPDAQVYDVSNGQELTLQDGMKAKLNGTDGLLVYTRIWIIGKEDNIKRIYFANHGDGASDYSESTKADREKMESLLPEGEGAIVAYPLSTGHDWPGFQSIGDQRKHYYVILKMFKQLADATGKPINDMRFEQFSLSGGGRVNHALMRLILENYDSDTAVKQFADNNMRGIHDGDSLCYNIDGEDGMTQSYIDVLKKFPQVRASFIHNTSGEMSYVQKYHRKVAAQFKELAPNEYPYGGSLSIDNNRLRFWASKTHWEAWKGQFGRVFFPEAN